MKKIRYHVMIRTALDDFPFKDVEKDELKIFDALEWLATMCSHRPALPEIHLYWNENVRQENKAGSCKRSGTAMAGRCPEQGGTDGPLLWLLQ